MNGISRDFAPPFKLIAPYFLVGTLFYLASAIGLFFFDTSSSYGEMGLIGWVHLYLLGFVMMIIFGAMAQLVPVVIEVGHAAVDFFYIIYPLLAIGTIMMVVGFTLSTALLPFGGLIVLVSMSIFAANLFWTLKKGAHKSIVVSVMGSSNIFLLLGIMSGLVMALAFGGLLGVDPHLWLKAHVFAVFGGYVILTIMGLSMVLLPMFGLSHGFDEKPMQWSYRLMLLGVPSVMIGSLLSVSFLEWFGIALVLVALNSYFYQVYLIFKTRARKENDVWVKSLFFAYATLLLSVLFSLVYLFGGSEAWLMSSGWLLIAGFAGFLITSHLYKIIPFLVWFERYAPLVGKQKVPMLHEMVPKRQADAQMIFTASGVSLVALGFLLGSDALFYAGSSAIVVGASYLLYSVYTMMQYGKEVL
jgi:hypothetical protein